MKAGTSKLGSCGFTRLDAVILTTGVILFVLVGLPYLADTFGLRQKRRSSRINCASNLKQITLAFRMWSNDHHDQFPVVTSTNDEGTLEFVNTTQVFRHFEAISNELNSPKVLLCPKDRKHKRAAVWTNNFANSNISYFVGLIPNCENRQAILSGDRNIRGGAWTKHNVMVFGRDTPAAWRPDMHRHAGYLALADGSADQTTTPQLQAQLKASSNLVTRLAIPVAK